MALSKLSHIILVCPHLDENYLDQLTKLSFRFLWSNKPDRVKRVEAILPISKGGINMPDIKCFWESLKCSWAKRMMQPNSAWLKVLQANILYSGYDLDDIIYEGPDVIQNCALKQSNKFWKETLLIFAKLTTEISFYRPDYFFDLNLFDNNHKYGNNTFKKYNFPILWSKI